MRGVLPSECISSVVDQSLLVVDDELIRQKNESYNVGQVVGMYHGSPMEKNTKETTRTIEDRPSLPLKFS